MHGDQEALLTKLGEEQLSDMPSMTLQPISGAAERRRGTVAPAGHCRRL